MRGRILVLGVVLLLVSSSGCMGETKTADMTTTQIQETETSIPSTEGEKVPTSIEVKETTSQSDHRLNDVITYSNFIITFTSLEKAMHPKFTDFDTSVEHYRLTFTIKNTGNDRLQPCNLKFTLLDAAKHQLDDSFTVMDDGFEGEEIFPGVTATFRGWWETQNNLEGDIEVYIKSVPCDELCEMGREMMGMPPYTPDKVACMDKELKLVVSENEILTPTELVLLKEETTA